MLELDDLEAVCGRPLAFRTLVDALLGLDPGSEDELRRQRIARGAELRFDPDAGMLWLIWPWAPDDPRGSWWRCRADDLASFRRRLPSSARRAELSLWVCLSRAPAEPEAWLRECSAWLAGALDCRIAKPELIGPRELVELGDGPAADGAGGAMLRLPRALRARPEQGSPARAALVEALDAGEASDEHWAVLADELLAVGDPLAESLALSLAARQPARGERARLQQRAEQHERARVRGLARERQLLTFAGETGQRFDVLDFGPQVGLEPGARQLQLWARRSGPFVTHLLINSDFEGWDGLGLPASLLHAPELRYLSPRRCVCITPSCGELSGSELPGFALGELQAAREQVYAVEARLHGVDLRQASLAEWVLDGAELDGALADLGTDFSAASFVDARVSASVDRQLRSHGARTLTPGRGRRRPVDARGRVLVSA